MKELLNALKKIAKSNKGTEIEVEIVEMIPVKGGDLKMSKEIEIKEDDSEDDDDDICPICGKPMSEHGPDGMPPERMSRLPESLTKMLKRKKQKEY